MVLFEAASNSLGVGRVSGGGGLGVRAASRGSPNSASRRLTAPGPRGPEERASELGVPASRAGRGRGGGDPSPSPSPRDRPPGRSEGRRGRGEGGGTGGGGSGGGARAMAERVAAAGLR